MSNPILIESEIHFKIQEHSLFFRSNLAITGHVQFKAVDLPTMDNPYWINFLGGVGGQWLPEISLTISNQPTQINSRTRNHEFKLARPEMILPLISFKFILYQDKFISCFLQNKIMRLSKTKFNVKRIHHTSFVGQVNNIFVKFKINS